MPIATPRFTEKTIDIACQNAAKGSDYVAMSTTAKVAGVWAVVIDTVSVCYTVTHVSTGLAAYRTPSRDSVDHLAAELAGMHAKYQAGARFGEFMDTGTEADEIRALVFEHRSTFRGAIQRDPFYKTATGLDVYLYRPRLGPRELDDSPAYAEFEAPAESVSGYRLAAGRRTVIAGTPDDPRGYVQQGPGRRWYLVLQGRNGFDCSCFASKVAAVRHWTGL